MTARKTALIEEMQRILRSIRYSALEVDELLHDVEEEFEKLNPGVSGEGDS